MEKLGAVRSDIIQIIQVKNIAGKYEIENLVKLGTSSKKKYVILM